MKQKWYTSIMHIFELYAWILKMASFVTIMQLVTFQLRLSQTVDALQPPGSAPVIGTILLFTHSAKFAAVFCDLKKKVKKKVKERKKKK